MYYPATITFASGLTVPIVSIKHIRNNKKKETRAMTTPTEYKITCTVADATLGQAEKESPLMLRRELITIKNLGEPLHFLDDLRVEIVSPATFREMRQTATSATALGKDLHDLNEGLRADLHNSKTSAQSVVDALAVAQGRITKLQNALKSTRSALTRERNKNNV